MRLRSITVFTLALAALAGGVISGIAFASFAPGNQPTAWLFNLAACTLVLALSYVIRGGGHGPAILLGTFALCLPAAGPALAALAALTLHSMRHIPEEGEPFVTGNPASSRSPSGGPRAVLGRPLATAVRSLSPINQFRLLAGVRSLSPIDSRPVLLRFRDAPNAQLQLFAQGGLSDAVEAAERHLSALAQRAHAHPAEAATHCAMAEVHLRLLEHHLIDEDSHRATWDAASRAIAKALEADPDDALSLMICSRLNLIGGDPAKAELAARALAKVPGHGETAALLLAEASFDGGDFESVPSALGGVLPGAQGRDEILDFWRKPRPAAYA